MVFGAEQEISIKIYQKSHQASSGFTLLELLITIIVVAILVALGVINYTGSRERAIGREARANLKLIAAAEKIYRMETGGYLPADTGTAQECIQNINTHLKLSLTSGTSRNWDYSVTADVSTFTAYGDRVDSVPVPYKSCRYSLTQSQEEPEASDSTACP